MCMCNEKSALIENPLYVPHSFQDSLLSFNSLIMICLGVAVFEFSYLEFVEYYVDYLDDPGKMYKLLERH